ncbi:(4Fe-4S)-binding protein [Catalinimonas niigatensis]|uniref:(4Fe-4S)-binding protein n=1 Tax=Catalinimonas niigatensis TaxID=1397264 RepID=UPI002666D5BE|nr:(4Fe-4S)-binding protein [Catalinimonas niigatensis]WPP52263.1 (4Fe-4S)-binding protein [Catalinimonas niigatensis]
MNKEEIIKTYTNGEITVVWDAAKCRHTGICLAGLPRVFNLKQKPWIDMSAADTASIEKQVSLCPSGALGTQDNDTYYTGQSDGAAEVVLTPGGPLTLYGKVLIKNLRGKTINEVDNPSFCRCGKSAQPPFCDGGHARHT